MIVYGVDRDEEPVADLMAAQAPGDEGYYFLLSFAEACELEVVHHHKRIILAELADLFSGKAHAAYIYSDVHQAGKCSGQIGGRQAGGGKIPFIVGIAARPHPLKEAVYVCIILCYDELT